MIDLSEEPIEENIEISKKYLEKNEQNGYDIRNRIRELQVVKKMVLIIQMLTVKIIYTT